MNEILMNIDKIFYTSIILVVASLTVIKLFDFDQVGHLLAFVVMASLIGGIVVAFVSALIKVWM